MSVTIWLHILRSSCASVASSLVSPFRGRLRAAILIEWVGFQGLSIDSADSNGPHAGPNSHTYEAGLPCLKSERVSGVKVEN